MPAFDHFVGVGLGIDVHNERPDWRRIVKEIHDGSLPVDFLEVYTRGEVAGAREVREAVGDLPLLYHDDALDSILPGDLDGEPQDVDPAPQTLMFLLNAQDVVEVELGEAADAVDLLAGGADDAAIAEVLSDVQPLLDELRRLGVLAV